MKKLDLKDKKILYELDLNSRQSYRSVGRKVGLSKDAVISRVKKLQESGIIQMFYTRYDNAGLGLEAMRLYVKFQYTTPDKKEEIINHFYTCKYTTVLVTIDGRYDLLAVFIFKKFNDIYNFWFDTLEKYGNYFSERVISIFVREIDYPKAFLIDENVDRDKLVTTIGIAKTADVDNIDKKILELIGENSRLSTLEIAKRLNTTTTVVNYHLKKLKSLGVIKGFKLLINLEELGYKWYKADFFLKDHRNTQKIIKYLEKNPNMFCIDRTIGYADLEFEFFLKSTDDIIKIFEDISIKFPDSIKDYSYFRVVKPYKFYNIEHALNLCK